MPEHLCVQWHEAGTPQPLLVGLQPLREQKDREPPCKEYFLLAESIFPPLHTHLPRACTGREQHRFTPNKSPASKQQNHSLHSSKGTSMVQIPAGPGVSTYRLPGVTVLRSFLIIRILEIRLDKQYQ